MKILVVGGGSGGHITPTLAVASEIKHKLPSAKIIYVIGKGDKLIDAVKKNQSISDVFTVSSGKFRRYHGEGLKQWLDLPTLFKNIRDLFLVCIGFFEALLLLRSQKPDVILIKGGFVGVPVGLAAAILNIPYVTHDSDAVPGLANRLISQWAAKHAVAMPADIYSYPPDKTVQVGVPITKQFKHVSSSIQAEYKKSLGLDPNNPVLMITGGGLGALRLNEAVVKMSKTLFARHPQLHVLHIAGPGKADSLKQQYRDQLGSKAVQVFVEEFVANNHVYTGAADVIIARAGATTLAEFAAQAKASIIVPNGQLTGGHQLRNAEVLQRAGAIVVVDDEAVQKNPEILLQQTEKLLNDKKLRKTLGESLHATARFDSAEALADVVIEACKDRSSA